ncbi:hypothetical protein QQF64_000171 [Cirrhinus molitorella]|uniref:Immunoglobulin domain-containing protein n=1 Tax=Cirrhinus molitorella TaxID=172907 RepID=A0ABR3NWG2_9TELE
MWDVLFLFSSICTVVVGAAKTVTGYIGEQLDIRCPYESGYESNAKYFCKGECNIGTKNIMVKSGSIARDQRFSLTDNKTTRVFTITITDLRPEDEGQYWCAVEGTVYDRYSEIMLLVKFGSFVIVVTAEALVLLLIGFPLVIVALRKRKKNKSLLLSSIIESSPVLYKQIEDTGHYCTPEDRDTYTTVVYSSVS